MSRKEEVTIRSANAELKHKEPEIRIEIIESSSEGDIYGLSVGYPGRYHSVERLVSPKKKSLEWFIKNYKKKIIEWYERGTNRGVLTHFITDYYQEGGHIPWLDFQKELEEEYDIIIS